MMPDMIPYSSSPIKELSHNNEKISSFISGDETNIDSKTVKSFGDEWKAFHDFSPREIQSIGDDYFDLLTFETSTFNVLDVGCGSGRWALYLAPRVKFIEAIDPSMAVWVAKDLLKQYSNTRITHASVDNLPFLDNSFDLVYSLGVLHHLPNTQAAIHDCFKKIKSGGYFLLYLYYNLDNRGFLFKLLFKTSNALRWIISKFPTSIKKVVCDIIATIVYLPLAKLSALVALFSTSFASHIPLSYYRKTSFFIMRNDALDRFGTPLEKRFSKTEIQQMLQLVGFTNIIFSTKEPYWHVLAQKT
jgi:ubiquinone/menaquinone biosynthesis C-methylase UbiE